MKVFWSWQADLDPRLHQYLVRDALRDACDRLAEADGVEGPDRPEVDHDTLGLTGTPDIINGILRKIENAAAFVADLTPVGRTIPAELRPGTDPGQLPPVKYLQNPNVMSELGYADHAVGQDRIILVANTTRYPGPEALPFDWRHRRGPILYTLTDGASSEERREARQQLAGQLAARLEPILAQVAADRPPAPPLLTQRPSDEDPALWAGAEEGVQFNESFIRDEIKTARLANGPRLYVRLAVAGWTAQPRQALGERMEQRDIKLWVGGGNGSSGLNGDGAFAASGIADEGDATYSARGITQWFARTGEIWAIDTASFGADDNGSRWHFAYQLPFAYLARFLRGAVAALRSVSAGGRIEIALGASGLLASSLPGEFRMHRRPALADRVEVREEATSWPAERRNALLLQFWNALMDIYGEAPAPDVEAFEAAARIQLERSDSEEL